ncbi:hypothetical protein AGR8A_pAt20056 [Agrobacterium fabrum str. J-07]|nr:hypothetical protein AGR8A_pAt20056 [Agrobacterium fabrum str. J-07]
MLSVWSSQPLPLITQPEPSKFSLLHIQTCGLRILNVLRLPFSREHLFAGHSTFEPASQKE